MKKSLTIIALGLLTAFVLGSCSRKVARVDTQSQIDISGRWNDTDSRLASEELTAQLISGSWISNHLLEKSKKPVIIVGLVRNKSHEHIDAETFIKDIEKAIIKNDNVRLVQGGQMRDELRGERADQQDNASNSTVKKFGLETGADYMLQGNITSIVDAHKREKVVYYQIDLELTHLETNEKVWIGDKKIKKLVKN